MKVPALVLSLAVFGLSLTGTGCSVVRINGSYPTADDELCLVRPNPFNDEINRILEWQLERKDFHVRSYPHGTAPGVCRQTLVYTWAKEQAFGKHEPMPQKIVRPGVLDSGLYAYGVNLIIMVATFALFFILGMLLGAINLDGLMPLLWLAFVIASGPFITIMLLRSAICGKVRAGLNVKRAWEMFAAQNKTGKAFTSYWGPMAAAFGMTIVAFIIFFILFGVVLGTSLAPLAFSGYGMSYGYASAYAASTAFAAIMSFFPLIIILLFALFFIGTAASMVATRAFGYWMQDFNPRDWLEYQENAWYYQNSVL